MDKDLKESLLKQPKGNKPKINGDYFLHALEEIGLILHRKTGNQMNTAEKQIYTIYSDVINKAYLTKKY